MLTCLIHRCVSLVRSFARALRQRVSILTKPAEPAVAVDYLALVDSTALEPAVHASDDTIAMIAARVGRTRLIDNVILGA